MGTSRTQGPSRQIVVLLGERLKDTNRKEYVGSVRECDASNVNKAPVRSNVMPITLINLFTIAGIKT